MTRLDTWLRILFVAVLLLATVANTLHVVERGEPSHFFTMLLLACIGAGVGWYMLGGER